jgi:hypothetical protein
MPDRHRGICADIIDIGGMSGLQVKWGLHVVTPISVASSALVLSQLIVFYYISP